MIKIDPYSFYIRQLDLSQSKCDQNNSKTREPIGILDLDRDFLEELPFHASFFFIESFDQNIWASQSSQMNIINEPIFPS